MENAVQLYRKRFIPDETIHLKDDRIVHHTKELIITKWNTLKPRNDIHHGISAYFLEQGFKVSKVFDKNNNVVYWYCDIINTKIDAETSSYVFEDLLLDVVVYENGFVKVLDTGEVADALEESLIDVSLAIKSLRILDSLLSLIYSERFCELQTIVNNIE